MTGPTDSRGREMNKPDDRSISGGVPSRRPGAVTQRRNSVSKRALVLTVVPGALVLVALWGLALAAQAAPSGVKASIKKGELIVTGTPGADAITLRLRAGDANTLEIDVGADGSANFQFDRARFDRITVNGSGNGDTIVMDRFNGSFTDTERTTVLGGDGDDTLIGANGDETLSGGPGGDFLDGNQGLDTLNGGDGPDLFQWDPGDSSDTLTGGTGEDRLVFNGSGASERVDLTPTPTGHVQLRRDIAAIVMDLDDIETIDHHALGGTDTLTIDDLTATDLTTLNTHLAATGGAAADGVGDGVIVQGTSGADVIAVADDGSALVVQGLHAIVRITGADATLDRLTVNGLEGDDTITATPGAAALMLLSLVP